MWGQRCDLESLQLVRRRFNVMCLKKLRIPEYTECPGFPLVDFFFSNRRIPGWQCQDLLGSVCESVFQHHFSIWIAHHSPELKPIRNPRNVLSKTLRDSSIINIRSCCRQIWRKSNGFVRWGSVLGYIYYTGLTVIAQHIWHTAQVILQQYSTVLQMSQCLLT